MRTQGTEGVSKPGREASDSYGGVSPSPHCLAGGPVSRQPKQTTDVASTGVPVPPPHSQGRWAAPRLAAAVWPQPGPPSGFVALEISDLERGELPDDQAWRGRWESRPSSRPTKHGEAARVLQRRPVRGENEGTRAPPSKGDPGRRPGSSHPLLLSDEPAAQTRLRDSRGTGGKLSHCCR